MEVVDHCFFRGAFTCRRIGGRMNTARFAVIFLSSSGREAIFLDIGATTFLTTQHTHHPYQAKELTAVRIIPLPDLSGGAHERKCA
jgi:hypothetical protein